MNQTSTQNKVLRYSILTLLFIIPFTSLVVSTSLFFPYITGKNIDFRVFVEIAFALYLILAIREPKYRPRFTTILLSFIAFIVVISIADVSGVYPFKSFWSNFERMEGLVTHLHLLVYFIMMTAMLNTERIWTYFFQTSLVASVIIGFRGLGEIATQGGRISSTLGNSSYLGIYMLFNVFIAGFLLVRLIERKKIKNNGVWLSVGVWLSFLYTLVILFDFYILYNTGTRGAFLGLGIGALFTSIAFAIFEKNKGLKRLGIAVLVLIVLAFGSLAVFKNTSFVKGHDLLARFSELATFKESGIEQFATTQGAARFGIWHVAYEGFKEHPILGWGQDNFNLVFNKYYDPSLYGQEQWFDRAHDVFFDWLIAGGALGLIAYLSLFASTFFVIWKSRKIQNDDTKNEDVKNNDVKNSEDQNTKPGLLFSDKVLISALLIAYFIHNLFVFDSISSYILFFGILAFVNIHDKRSIPFSRFYLPIKNTAYIASGSVVAVIIGVASLYYFSYVPYASASNLIDALNYENSAQTNPALYQSSLDSFNKSLANDHGEGVGEVREQLIQATSNVIFSNAPAKVKQAYVNKVVSELKTQLADAPGDTRIYLFYGSFLENLGNVASSTELKKEAVDNLKLAVQYSPKKQTAIFALGSALLSNQQYAEALTYFKQAFDEAPEYQEARLYYAIAEIYTGDNTGALTTLAPLGGTTYVGDLKLVRAYYDTKQLKMVGQILQYKLDLADKLYKSGDVTDAVTEVQEVESVQPNFKKDGDALIQEYNGGSASTTQ